MKTVSNVIAVSLFMAGSAFAAQPGAFGALEAAAPAAAVAAPAVPAPSRAPLKANPADLLDLSSGEADLLVSQARAQGFAIFQLDGSKMTTKPALMAHAARVLGLPADMDNWDAFIDYMNDMPQIHCNDMLLVIVRNSSLIKRADPRLYADLREVAQFSSKNTREWSRSQVTVKFVFVP